MRLIAIVIAILIGGIGLVLNERHIYNEGVHLNDTSYFYGHVDAPVLTGRMLEWAAWIITESPIRFFMCRFLLNQNGIHLVRELASRMPDLPPMYYPMWRLSAEETAKAQVDSDSEPIDEFIKSGFEDYTPKKNYKTSIDYHIAYKSGRVLPSTVIKRTFENAQAFQLVNIAFASMIENDIMNQAFASDNRWKAGKPLSVLDGVPVAFKDMICAVGHKLSHGENVGIQCTSDDPIVARFREAGAIIFGLTVMTEGGVTPLGYAAHYKGPFNAHSYSHYSGGSSSGSATVVAAGIVPIAIGFDGGGSIRIPASMSGIYGLGCTFGRVPFGGSALALTVIKAGPMTASADDATIAYAVMTQSKDKSHFYSELYGAGGTPPIHLNGVVRNPQLQGLKVGIFWEYIRDGDKEVVDTVLKSIDFLKSNGVEIVDITIPHVKIMALSHAIKIMSEFALQYDYKFYSEQVLEPNTRITIALGKTLTANEVIAGQRVRRYANDVMKQIFQDNHLDFLVLPTIGVKVPRIPENAKRTGENNNPLIFQLLKYIFLGNLLGLPSISIPIGADSDNMPIGLQLLGDHWNEHKLLRAARALERDYNHKPVPRTYYSALS